MNHLIDEKIPDYSCEIFHENKIKKINLSDYRGKWLVLLFYPADFTFICPTELEEAQDNYPEFEKLGAEIISVSTDTAFVHKAWHDNSPAISKVSYPMLADPTGKLCQLLGTYIEKEGLSLRATFIVSPEGYIKAYEMHSNNIGRNIKEILRKLQALKFSKEHKGQVCPASWIPGAKTLKPGVNLIGRI